MLLKKFRGFSIKKQFFIFSVFASVILIFLCIIVSFSMHKVLLHTNAEYVETLTDKFEAEISAIYQQADNVFTQLQYNIACTDLLQAESYQQINISTINALNQQKASIAWLNNAIADITFTNNLIHWSSIYSIHDMEMMKAQASASYGTESLGTQYSSVPSYNQTPYFVFSHTIYSDYKELGTVFISLDLQKSSMNLPAAETSNAYFLLYDSNDQITPFNCSSEVAEKIFKECTDNISFDKTSSSEKISRSLTTDSYMIQLVYLPAVRSYIISAIDISNANQKLNSVYALNWSVIAFSCLFIVLLGLMLYINFIVPINKFSDTITDIKIRKLRKLDKPLELVGCTEVRNISTEFTDLLLSINELNAKIVRTSNDLYEVELQRKIAEISFLRSQINPHFLYNTLELIRSTALENQVLLVGDIAVSMGKILRYSIKGSALVSLEQEIEITQAYLKIQQARFKDKIKIIYNISEEALKMSVIKMLLQPLVENAIFYGLEPKARDCILYIGGQLENTDLLITVRDNGVGIDRQTLASLHQTLESNVYDTSRHVGLVNTNARIKLQYGKQYGLSLTSTEGDGTCISIHLPAAIFTLTGGD